MAIPLFRVILNIFGYLTVCFSLVPLLRSKAWFVRIFDYPRSQKFWINLIVLIATLWAFDPDRIYDLIFLSVIAINQCYLFSQIWNYTPLASIQMKKTTLDPAENFGLMIANVFQENHEYARCKALIRKLKPDIFLLVETDEGWTESMQEFAAEYPYQIVYPQSNTYGICLYSKLKIKNSEVRHLVEPDVPSLVADIETEGGKLFRLYGLHPKPPVPGESSDSAERDAEILIVGREAKQCTCPVIVAGDLNDVAWSFTTSLFLKISGLLDPRIGRGFFSTFHAHHRLLRWPLDHVFCSSHFTLSSIERLPDIGSDHFPIYIQVMLLPAEDVTNKRNERKPDAADLEMAEGSISEAKTESK